MVEGVNLSNSESRIQKSESRILAAVRNFSLGHAFWALTPRLARITQVTSWSPKDRSYLGTVGDPTIARPRAKAFSSIRQNKIDRSVNRRFLFITIAPRQPFGFFIIHPS